MKYICASCCKELSLPETQLLNSVLKKTCARCGIKGYGICYVHDNAFKRAMDRELLQGGKKC